MAYPPPPEKTQSKARTLVLGFVIALVLLVSAFLGGFYTYQQNQRPPSFEKIAARGLDGEIHIYKDSMGVPHIIAVSDNDLFFGQGYTQAQDRLWQLEYHRRIINGELSEAFGENLLNLDIFLRSLGLKRAANITYQYLDSETKAAFESYVRGVNFYIATHNKTLPIEFELAGITPKNWTVLDSMAMQGFMALTLSLRNANKELLRRDLIETFNGNLTLVEQLMPIVFGPARDYFLNMDLSEVKFKNKTIEMSKDQVNSKPSIFEEFENLLGPLEGFGSNNWVVGPEKSAYGKPILANDMHLDLTTPSIWYEMNLYSPNTHVWGFTLVGAPYVIAGHNEYVAWGFTNTQADVVDLYYLKETEDGNQYFVNNSLKNYTLIDDSIPVKGWKNGSYQYTIKVSDYGPILDFDGEKYALQWTVASDTPLNNIFKAIQKMNHATDALEFRQALTWFSAPGQNVVFADIYGNFGYQYTGLTPIRNKGYGLIPVNGSSGEYYWKGYVPFDELYGELNPKKGYFATANANHFPENSTIYISDLFAPPYRWQRIDQVLSQLSNVTLDDMKNLQSDSYLLPAETLTPAFLEALNNDTLTGIYKEAYNVLSSWDYYMDVNTVGGTIYQTLLLFVQKNMFLDELGPKLFSQYYWISNSIMEDLVTMPNFTIYDNIETPNIVENMSYIVNASFYEAVDYLSETLEPSVSTWRWGRLHQAMFYHVFGNNVPTVEFNNGPVETDGAFFTVNAGNAPYWVLTEENTLELSYIQTMSSSERLVVLVEPTWSNISVVVPPGQSGNLGSPHYRDQLQDWAEFKYHTTVFDPEVAQTIYVESIIIVPLD